MAKQDPYRSELDTSGQPLKKARNRRKATPATPANQAAPVAKKPRAKKGK